MNIQVSPCACEHHTQNIIKTGSRLISRIQTMKMQSATTLWQSHERMPLYFSPLQGKALVSWKDTGYVLFTVQMDWMDQQPLWKIGHKHQGSRVSDSSETLLRKQKHRLKGRQCSVEVKRQVSVQEIANKSREKKTGSAVQNNSGSPKDREARHSNTLDWQS